MAKFLILSLPRSRSKWLSEFLAFNGRFAVGHDLAVDCSSVQDFEDALDAVDGSVETGAVLGWRLLVERHPDWRIATVFRPIEEIIASFSRIGWVIDPEELEYRYQMLLALSTQPGVENFTFSGLEREAECLRLWEFCLGRDFDFEWWMEMARKNVQIDMGERLRRLRANAPGLLAMRNEIVAEIARLDISCALN